MDWKAGDWVVFDLRIGQIKKIEDGGFAEFSDGSFGTSGMLADRFRPLTLHNKCTIEYFDYYYNELRKLNGEAGFNYPYISQHFAQLSLDAIDEGENGDQKVPREKAEQFYREARDYKPMIQGIPLFRQNFRAARS